MNRRNSLKLGAGLIAGMTVAPTLSGSEVNLPMNGSDSLWDVVKNRRSVRKFKSTPVPEEHLMQIIDAARMAPTAGNQQPWKFILVQEKEQIDRIKEETLVHYEKYQREKRNLSGEELEKEMKKSEKRLSEGYLSAPAYIVVLTDNNSKYPSYNDHDGPLAAGYLLLAARALGYGTVYITDAIPPEVTQKALNIPDSYKRVCITPVGVPFGWPTKPKNELGDFIVRESF